MLVWTHVHLAELQAKGAHYMSAEALPRLKGCPSFQPVGPLRLTDSKNAGIGRALKERLLGAGNFPVLFACNYSASKCLPLFSSLTVLPHPQMPREEAKPGVRSLFFPHGKQNKKLERRLWQPRHRSPLSPQLPCHVQALQERGQSGSPFKMHEFH